MSMTNRFSKAVSTKLGHYVYIYIDPLDGEPFYIGKGQGNRCFSHMKEGGKGESAKLDRIRRIQAKGKSPEVKILAHGLQSEAEAYKVEAAVIDVLGKEKLTNLVRGYHARSNGLMTVEQVTALYQHRPVTVTEPALLIRINKLYRHTMTPGELYEATRGFWKVRADRNHVDYALAVYDSVVREVYRVEAWFKAGTTFTTRDTSDRDLSGRWEFVGRVAENGVRRKYLYGDVSAEFPAGAQNPVKYVNVK
jgi:hypothetical protein